MLLVHVFVCFVRVSFCHFSLPLGVGGWLRFVTVALPGLFYFFSMRRWQCECDIHTALLIGTVDAH